MQVQGGFLAVTASAQDFIDFIAAYILNFEQNNSAKWFLDQMALVAACTWFAANVPQLRIIDAPRKMINLSAEHSLDYITWQYKGLLKLESFE